MKVRIQIERPAEAMAECHAPRLSHLAAAGALAEASGLHVILYDEFDTSVRARQRLGAKTRAQEKEQLDALAAAVLLSDYLESMV